MGRWISQAILTASLKIKLPLISFLAYISHLNMVKPTTKKELQKIIIETIDREGNECDLNFIDTSLITDMSNLFCVMHDFNGKINKWDVSNVKDMSGMFWYANFFNQPLDSWQVNSFPFKEDIFVGTKLKSLPKWVS